MTLPREVLCTGLRSPGFAAIRRALGTLDNVDVSHLATVQNTQVYGLGMTDQKLKHHRMRNRLEAA